MNRRHSSSFLSAAFWNMVLTAFSFPIGAVTAVVVARHLGPAGKGEYALATLLASLCYTLLEFGIPAAVSYFLPGRRLPAPSMVKTVAVLAMVLSATAIGLIALLDASRWSAYVLGVPRLSHSMWLAILGLPFFFLGTFLQFVILALGHRVLFAAVPAAAQLISTALIGAFFFLGRLTPFTAVASVVASQVLGALILIVYVESQVHWLRAPFLPSTAWASLTQYAAVRHVGTILQFLVQRVDVLLLSVFLDLRAVGLYSVAYGVSELLLLFPRRFGVLYFPRVAAQQNPTADARELRSVSSVVFLATAAAALLLAALAPFAVPLLYGEAFRGSTVALVLLLPGVCALATGNIQITYLTALGRVRTPTVICGCGLTVNVLINLFLIPRYGIAGAAFASSLTYAIQTALLLGAVGRLTATKPWSMLTSVSPDLLAHFIRRARESISLSRLRVTTNPPA